MSETVLRGAFALLEKPSAYLVVRPTAPDTRSFSERRHSPRARFSPDTFLARDFAWKPCHHDHAHAVAWTIEGALARAAGPDARAYLSAYVALTRATGAPRLLLETWAKGASHHAMRAALARAIDTVRQESAASSVVPVQVSG